VPHFNAPAAAGDRQTGGISLAITALCIASNADALKELEKEAIAMHCNLKAALETPEIKPLIYFGGAPLGRPKD